MTKTLDPRVAAIVAEADTANVNPLIESLDDPRAAGLRAKVQTLAARADASNAEAQWRSAILTSPEGRARPRAAARLIELSTPRTMPAERAVATLRGLKPEAVTPEAVETPAEPDARAARLEEIRLAGLHVRAGRGDAEAKRELRERRAAGCNI